MLGGLRKGNIVPLHRDLLPQPHWQILTKGSPINKSSSPSVEKPSTSSLGHHRVIRDLLVRVFFSIPFSHWVTYYIRSLSIHLHCFTEQSAILLRYI